MPAASTFWAPRAWLADGWHDRVVLEADSMGRWRAVTPDAPGVPPGATVLAGPALPSLVDAHGHAFQRAFAGLAERRDDEQDDFWSWRDRMYQVALRVTPEQLRAIGSHLYVELLRGGYTQMCEFHYLHHQADGQPFADPLAMSWALADAAADAGIGLTLLPVLYERAGFAALGLRTDQRRFAGSADSVWAMHEQLQASGRAHLNAGVALHSLRAAGPGAIHQLRALAEGHDIPIHIHAAEQLQEVEDCLLATGARPIEWLAREGLLDARWQLVHATHTTPAEIDAVAASGAGVVLCPSTEANLGDGLCDLRGWLASGTPLSIGSDSHVTRAWREELRVLEYGQRLSLRQRNVGAAPAEGLASTAARLLSRIAPNGRPAGFARWGLVPGARADLLVADLQDHALLGVPPTALLDALVFSSPARPWRDVMVAGQLVVQDHRHARASAIGRRFESAMQSVWKP